MRLRQFTISLVITALMLTFFPDFKNEYAFAKTYYDVEVPEKPQLTWKEKSYYKRDSQRIEMKAKIPDGAKKIKYFLFANDRVYTYGPTTSKEHTFGGIKDNQTVWGYVVAYGKNSNHISKPSEWDYELIDNKSDDYEDVMMPDEPEIKWETPTMASKNNQKVTLTAEMPSGARYLRFFLIADGEIKKSNRIQDESYTFKYIDYDQLVIGYVKAYSDDKNESDQSGTVQMYIGDDGIATEPEKPSIRWINMGYDSPTGQKIVVRTSLPEDSINIKYYLFGENKILNSKLTKNTTYVFDNVESNQSVVAAVKSYDMWGNVSKEAKSKMIRIPDMNKDVYDDTEDENAPRIKDIRRGVSIKDFELPEMIVKTDFYFSDVSKNDKELNEALKYFYSTNVFTNTFSSKFYPSRSMTRIEFLGAVMKTAGIKKDDTGYVSQYTDIDKDYKYYDEVMTANKLRIMNGYSDYTFRPGRGLTYGAAARALTNAFKIRKCDYEGESIIDDISQHCVDALYEANIITRMPSNINNYVTRADAVKMLYRIVKIKIEN